MYPALAVLQNLDPRSRTGLLNRESETSLAEAQLGSADPEIELLWVGGQGGMEADLIKKAGVPYSSIPAAGIHGVGMRALPSNLWAIAHGTLASWGLLRRFRPQVLFFTGGYLAVPMAMASRLPGLGKPRPAILLFVPDIEPGLAIRTLTRFSDRIAVTFEDSMVYFPKSQKVTVTGYPTRENLKQWDIKTARKALGLSLSEPVLLVAGGSKGARSINIALGRALPELLDEMQVVHISGRLDWPEVEKYRSTLTKEQASRYKAFKYLHEEMGAALAAADLVVSRAGASALGEYPLFGLPAILVPYPYAWRYQQVNASYLAKHGAAIVVEDKELADQLSPVVRNLLQDRFQLEAMSQAMRSLERPGAAREINVIIRNLVTGEERERISKW